MLFRSQCVRAGRLFVSRMLDSLRCSMAETITIDGEFHKDITWWQAALQTANKTFLLMHLHLVPADAQVHLDACLTGCGGTHLGQFYHAAFPESILASARGIVHLEMLNIVVAARLWGPDWTGLHIQIMCDNWACVCVLNNGRSRDTFLLACAREISLLMTEHDFRLTTSHIPGKNNDVADALSRCSSLEDCPEAVQLALRSKTQRLIPAEQFIVID